MYKKYKVKFPLHPNWCEKRRYQMSHVKEAVIFEPSLVGPVGSTFHTYTYTTVNLTVLYSMCIYSMWVQVAIPSLTQKHILPPRPPAPPTWSYYNRWGGVLQPVSAVRSFLLEPLKPLSDTRGNIAHTHERIQSFFFRENADKLL